MRVRLACSVALVVTVLGASDVLQACGDKFLLIGRGARFQKAYAAIHPASILIVQPLKSVKVAAVRDSRLVTALKMAGHRVQVVKQPADLADVLGRSRYDIILAERADVSSIPQAGPAGQAKPAVVAVMEQPSAADLAAARQQLDYVLDTPLPLSRILNLLDDVMKARKDRSRTQA